MNMNFKRYKSGLVFALAVGSLVSCQKSFDEKTVQQQDFSNSAIVQVHVATVNASRNYLFVDANQVTGALMSTGSIFPTTGTGFVVSPGPRAFLVRDTLRTSTQAAFSFAENLQVNRRYTIFLYDTITSPKQKTVETTIVTPTDTTCRIRFANFIYNPTAVTNVDVFSYSRNANIFTNIAVTDVTGYIPYASRVSVDTFYVRETGTTNLLYKTSMSNLTEKRNYTFVYRGSHRGTKTSTLFSTY